MFNQPNIRSSGGKFGGQSPNPGSSKQSGQQPIAPIQQANPMRGVAAPNSSKGGAKMSGPRRF